MSQPHWPAVAEPVAPQRLQVDGGRLAFAQAQCFAEQEAPRLKLVVVLAGRITIGQQGQPEQRMQGPFVHCSLEQDPCTVLHGLEAGEQLHYVSARLPLTALHEHFGLSTGQLLAQLGAQQGLEQGARSLQWNAAATPGQQWVARQILACPWQGLARQLYLSGKGLELLASALSAVPPSPAGPGLDARTLRQLARARDLLQRDLEHPPSLRELAREVGLNVNKLSQGFRELHGCTVFAWLRDQRMQLAQELLASRQLDVGSAARLCGYSVSHFSKLFRQRFGVLPSEVTGR